MIGLCLVSAATCAAPLLADGALLDVDDAVDTPQPVDAMAGRAAGRGIIEMSRDMPLIQRCQGKMTAHFHPTRYGDGSE